MTTLHFQEPPIFSLRDQPLLAPVLQHLLNIIQRDACTLHSYGMLHSLIESELRIQSLYKAFVWNPVTRQFYDVEAFQEIQEPDIDSKAKTITSFVRDAGKLYIDTFKWKNGKLTKIASKKD